MTVEVAVTNWIYFGALTCGMLMLLQMIGDSFARKGTVFPNEFQYE